MKVRHQLSKFSVFECFLLESVYVECIDILTNCILIEVRTVYIGLTHNVFNLGLFGTLDVCDIFSTRLFLNLAFQVSHTHRVLLCSNPSVFLFLDETPLLRLSLLSLLLSSRFLLLRFSISQVLVKTLTTECTTFFENIINVLDGLYTSHQSVSLLRCQPEIREGTFQRILGILKSLFSGLNISTSLPFLQLRCVRESSLLSLNIRATLLLLQFQFTLFCTKLLVLESLCLFLSRTFRILLLLFNTTLLSLSQFSFLFSFGSLNFSFRIRHFLFISLLIDCTSFFKNSIDVVNGSNLTQI